jgi:ribosome maturation factor RimP
VSDDPTLPDSELPAVPSPVRTLEDRIRALAEEASVASGLYIVGVRVKGHPGSRIVEVFADGDEGGIDDLAGLTRRLNVLLDIEDPIAGHYRLDVSTPGADRPLSDVRQYPKHVGRTLRVRYAPEPAADDGAEPPGEPGPVADIETTGTLTAATPDAITIQPATGEPVVVPVARLREALVVLPW